MVSGMGSRVVCDLFLFMKLYQALPQLKDHRKAELTESCTEEESLNQRTICHRGQLISDIHRLSLPFKNSFFQNFMHNSCIRSKIMNFMAKINVKLIKIYK